MKYIGVLIITFLFCHQNTYCYQILKYDGDSSTSLEVSVGLSVQFFLISRSNNAIPTSSFLNSQPLLFRSAQGLGIPLSIAIFSKKGLGVRYSRTIRYNYMRHLDLNFASNDNVERDLITDSSISLIKKLSNKKRINYLGIGYSIFTRNKRIELDSGVAHLEFRGFYVVAGSKLWNNIYLETKIAYIQGISFKPLSKYTIMPVIALRYRFKHTF